MDSRKEELLEKYWAAESSIEEEKELKGILKDSEDEGLEEVSALFSHFDEEAKIELDESFDDLVLNQIEEEKETKVISFNDYFKRYASIAAAVIVMAVSGYMFTQQQPEVTSEDTFETPEEAYAALKEKLLLVSNYMNKGQSAVEDLGSFATATESLGEITNLGSASQGMELLSEMNLENN